MQTYTCMHLTFSYTIGIKGTRPRTVPGTEQHACVHKEICIHGLLKMHSDAHTCITQKGKGYKEFSTVWHFHGLISPSVAVNTSQWPSSSGYSLSIDGAVDGRKLGDQVSRFNQNQDEKPQNKILTFAVTSACVWVHLVKRVAYISDHTQLCMCTFTGVREADSRKALKRCCVACWDTDSPDACLLLLSLTRWWGFSSFSVSPSVAVADVASELWSNCAFIPLFLPLSSAGGLQQQGAPDSQTTSLLPTSAEAAAPPLWSTTDTFWPEMVVQQGECTPDLICGFKCGILKYFLFHRLRCLDPVWPCGELEQILLN